MTEMVTVPCWDVQVWRGHWQLRSTHASAAAAQQEVTAGRRRDPHVRLRVIQRTRRVASFTQAPAPTAAQRFREAQADRMVIRRQAFTYYKSGSNGTEVLQPPKDGGK